MRLLAVVLLLGLVGCAAPTTPEVPEGPPPDLSSLRQLDDHPLWTMRFDGDYDRMKNVTQPTPATPFGCSLFATNDAADPLFARNFDWDPAPAMLLFTDPADGYASASMVDLSYLGVTDPAAEAGKLADAPLLPFDGMNEKGLAIGLAAVDDAEPGSRPDRPTVGSVRIIRLVLDTAATVEEALRVFQEHNIDFDGGPPLHYLVADATGKSAAIELVDGEVIALPTQAAVNFTLSGTDETTRRADNRYRTATDGLAPGMDWRAAMDLLSEVQQGHTQWSVVYGLKTGSVHVATGKRFDDVHELKL
ncbi:MAG: C45 family peptidase [Actinophytocola sp.]|uniref:carcinine hydrolase/isopenicillin-N N-acyltransferase family protein n=1 Tax=Actinophytocola sp. TaxID=1872138 RepID=UPI003C76346B